MLLLKYNLANILALLIGLSMSVTAQVWLFPFQAAAQQPEDCNKNHSSYEFALMKQADKQGIPIDRNTAHYFSYGTCDSHAYLQLDTGQTILFHLAHDAMCPIRKPLSRTGIAANLQLKLTNPQFWQSVLSSLHLLSEDFHDCEIFVFIYNDKIAILGRNKPNSHSDPKAILYYEGHAATVSYFLTAKYRVPEYQIQLFRIWENFSYAHDAIVVAGDKGLIIQDGSAHFFSEFNKADKIRKICDYDDIRNSMKTMPAGFYAEKYLSNNSGETEVYKALAQYMYRQPLRAIVFGCKS